MKTENAPTSAPVERLAGRPSCASCRFFNDDVDDYMGYGACQRHAPRINVTMADRYYQGSVSESDDDNDAPDWIAQRGWFPLMQPDDWCGEFQESGAVQ